MKRSFLPCNYKAKSVKRAFCFNFYNNQFQKKLVILKVIASVYLNSHLQNKLHKYKVKLQPLQIDCTIYCKINLK